MIKSIEWTEAGVVILDQRFLPLDEVYQTCADYRDVAEAIRSMRIRGAPAIGIAAAMGVALGMTKAGSSPSEDLDATFETICSTLASTRVTAANLSWALARMRAVFVSFRPRSIETLRQALVAEALAIQAMDLHANQSIGHFGQQLVPLSFSLQYLRSQIHAGTLAT